MIRYIVMDSEDGMETFQSFPEVMEYLYTKRGHAVIIDTDHDAAELRDMLLLLISVIELSSARRKDQDAQ